MAARKTFTTTGGTDRHAHSDANQHAHDKKDEDESHHKPEINIDSHQDTSLARDWPRERDANDKTKDERHQHKNNRRFHRCLLACMS